MITSYSTKRTQIQHESSSHVEINLQNYAIEDERRDDTFSTDEELSEEQDATQTVPSGSSNNEDDGNDSGSSSDRYEEDVEEQTLVEARRRKLPKSKVDDKFFNLAEMEAFVCAQDKEEEERQQKMGRNLGQFDMAEEMDSIIRSYEEENLKSRSWALQGEAMADERRKDELLEQFMDVDYRAAVPPTISMEKTAHLEALIKKRIKEKLFDDAVRKYRENEALIPIYRNETAIEQNVRKSLAEVYEEKFAEELNKQDDAVSQQAKPELDPTVAAIQRDMDELFLQLDALSHFQFRPRPVREEVKIVNNMPSLNAEEVGPTASAEPDANLLAPEEIMRHAKSAPKAADERNETDRKRERRHKKRKQRVLASIGAMGGKKGKKVESKEDINLMDKRGLLKRARIGGGTGKKLNFAAEMHQLMAEGSDGPAERKKRRNKGKKTENPRKKIFTLAS